MRTIAYVGRDGRIHLIDAGGDRPLTWAHQPASPWSRGMAKAERCAWPSISPDHSRVAFIRVDGPEVPGPGRVEVHERDGVEGSVVFAIDEAVPLHAGWNGSGTHVSVICQSDDRLELWVAALDGREPRLVDEGVPLFSRWLEDGARLVIHAGADDGQPGRLVVRDPYGTAEDVLLPHDAGSFCTPQVIGGRIVSVTNRDGASVVLSTDLTGHQAHELWRGKGLVTVVPLAGTPAVAVAAADRHRGGPYGDLWRVPLDGAPATRIAAGPFHALEPLPGGAVAVARFAPARRDIAWTLHRDGDAVALGRVRPTPDQQFHLHFFEQLGPSHPASDGELLLQGVVGPTGHELVGLDLTDPGRVHRLGEGSYGVFAPERAPKEEPCP
ncbi:MAG: hypothetical protein VX265_14390 [Myxococcota bacterium]|nr:hypothetical protein [Myxococcota bacterium]